MKAIIEKLKRRRDFARKHREYEKLVKLLYYMKPGFLRENMELAKTGYFEKKLREDRDKSKPVMKLSDTFENPISYDLGMTFTGYKDE